MYYPKDFKPIKVESNEDIINELKENHLQELKDLELKNSV
jgi:hypothetical protein